jgi:hypothetical protein
MAERLKCREWKPRRGVLRTLLACYLLATMACSREEDAGQERAIAAIEGLGGWVIRDQTGPEKPAVRVFLDLFGTKVTDDDLVLLRSLTNLRELRLSNTQVTDAGVEHLKGLTRLQILDLSDTQVTDTGVEELQRELPDVRILR